MIKANELRIGNWILYPKYWGDKPIRVTGISVLDRTDDSSGIYEEYLYLLGNDFLTDSNFDEFIDYKNGVLSPMKAEPIPLTEDILLKCGFEYKAKSKLGVDSFGEIFIADNGICHISDERDTNYSFMAKCEYLHQLQNLYFALTGEELNVKL